MFPPHPLPIPPKVPSCELLKPQISFTYFGFYLNIYSIHACMLCFFAQHFFFFFFLLLFFFFTYNVSTASTFASTSISLMKMLCPKSPMATLLTNPEAIYLSVIYSLLLNSVKEIAGQQFLKFYDSVVLWFTSYLSKCCFMFACFVFKLIN